MEAVGSTYDRPLVSNRAEGERTRPLFGPVALPPQNSGSTGMPSAATGLQEGIRPSVSAPDEFKPYSNGATPNDLKSTAAVKNQGDAANQVDVSTKQEDPQVQAAVAQLKSIEEKVKAHEAAHKSAGGTMTGPVSYSYTRGPDGRNYITGGEVPISVSPGKTPQETISRMQQVIQAALAPADPSPQDRAVAAQAAAQQQVASRELAAAATQTEPAPPASTAVEFQQLADSSVAQNAQSANASPAVTRDHNETANRPGGSTFGHTDAGLPAVGADRATQFVMTPATPTGNGVQQPVSYYA